MDIVSLLTLAEIPVKLRCAVCNKLAVDAYKLPCCDQSICGACQAASSDTCAVCTHSPLDASTCTPNKSLRLTVKAFTKAEERKRNKGSIPPTPVAETPVEKVVEPIDHASTPAVEITISTESTHAPTNASVEPASAADDQTLDTNGVETIHASPPVVTEETTDQQPDNTEHTDHDNVDVAECETGDDTSVNASTAPGAGVAQQGHQGMAWNSSLMPMMPMNVPGMGFGNFPSMMGLPFLNMNPMQMPNMMNGFGGMGMNMNDTSAMNMGMGMGFGNGTWDGQNMGHGANLATGYGPNGGYNQHHNMPYGKQYPSRNNFQNRPRGQEFQPRGQFRGRGGFPARGGHGSGWQRQSLSGNPEQGSPHHDTGLQSRDDVDMKDIDAAESSRNIDAMENKADSNTNIGKRQGNGLGTAHGETNIDLEKANNLDMDGALPSPAIVKAPPINAPTGPKAMRAGLPNSGRYSRPGAIPTGSKSQSAGHRSDRSVVAHEDGGGMDIENESLSRPHSATSTRKRKLRSRSRSTSSRRGAERDRHAKRGREYRGEDDHDTRMRSHSRSDGSRRRSSRPRHRRRHRDRSNSTHERESRREGRRHRRRSEDRERDRVTDEQKSHERKRNRADGSRDRDRNRETDRKSRRRRSTSKGERDSGRRHESSRRDRHSRGEGRSDRAKEDGLGRAKLESPSDDIGFRIRGSKSAADQAKAIFAPPSGPRKDRQRDDDATSGQSSVQTPTVETESMSKTKSSLLDPYAQEREARHRERVVKEQQRRESATVGKLDDDDEEMKVAADGAGAGPPTGPRSDKSSRKARRINYKYEDEMDEMRGSRRGSRA